jgi:uncharacterized peroxidase-related enzyme
MQMGHVSYLTKEQAAESVQPIYDDVEKKLGVMLNFFKSLAHNPGILQSFLALNGAVNKTKLPHRLRELAYLKASQVNGCDYCEHYHRALCRKAGLSDRQVDEIDRFELSDAYTDLERDVLRFAEGVTRSVKGDDAVVGRLREQLSEQELLELAVAVALANFTNRVNVSLKIDLP